MLVFNAFWHVKIDPQRVSRMLKIPLHCEINGHLVEICMFEILNIEYFVEKQIVFNEQGLVSVSLVILQSFQVFLMQENHENVGKLTFLLGFHMR